MNQEFEAIEIAAKAVDRITRRGRFAELQLSNGIVLTLRPVPPLLVQAIGKELQPPQPPKIYIEDQGREEENPSDPKYVRELAEFNEYYNTAVNNLLLATGTTVKYVPDGYFRPEDDEWIEQVQFAARIVDKTLSIEREDKTERYLCWLRFYALETGIDVALASSLPMQLAGISEGEVDEVMESFRSLSERGVDTPSSADSGSENGHSNNRAARRASSRVRGA